MTDTTLKIAHEWDLSSPYHGWSGEQSVGLSPTVLWHCSRRLGALCALPEDPLVCCLSLFKHGWKYEGPCMLWCVQNVLCMLRERGTLCHPNNKLGRHHRCRRNSARTTWPAASPATVETHIRAGTRSTRDTTRLRYTLCSKKRLLGTLSVHAVGVVLWAGAVPPELGGLTALTDLNLSFNRLSGE